MEKLIYKCLDPMLKENIDALVLGCTHYAYLIPQIKKIIGKNIQIIDSGLAVAKQTQRILHAYDFVNSTVENDNFHHFYINKDSEILVKFLKNFNNVKIMEKEF